jgi:hypothetical protein
MKVVIVILAVMAFIACLFLGLYAGGLTGMSVNPTLSVNPTQFQSTGEQHTIILIQTDDLTQASPKLISIWLLFYYPDHPKLTLLLLYPPLAGRNGIKARALGQKFALTSKGTLSQDFSASLQNFGFNYNGYIITDGYSLAQWIDWLGGIKLNENLDLQNGSTVIKSLPPSETGNDRGAWMKQVSTRVCDKLSGLPIDANWFTLMNNIAPSHFHTNLSVELLMGDWKKIKSVTEAITCEVMMSK